MSELMLHVSGGQKLAHDDMFGLYATRRYDSGEAITVCVGQDIGAADGTIDDYQAYKTLEQDAAPWVDDNGHVHQGNGGRHVMQVGDRLIDGQRDGYTGAQYANSAYRVPPKWSNKAELKAGGTIRVMRNKTIYPGDEILFAYHTDYWKRWGMTRKRGRPPKHTTTAQVTRKVARTITTSTSASAACHGDTKTPTDVAAVETVETQTANIGTRVVHQSTTRQRRGRGRSMGSTVQNKTAQTISKRTRARKQSQHKWSTVGRDAFDIAQQQVHNNHNSSRVSVQRFERGEGGGVT